MILGLFNRLWAKLSNKEKKFAERELELFLIGKNATHRPYRGERIFKKRKKKKESGKPPDFEIIMTSKIMDD